MGGNGWECLAEPQQNAFSAVRPPFVRPTAVQHFYADNDENDNVNDDNDNTKHQMKLLMGIPNKLSLDLCCL